MLTTTLYKILHIAAIIVAIYYINVASKTFNNGNTRDKN